MKTVGLKRKCAETLFATTEELARKGNVYALLDLEAAHVTKRVGGKKILTN